MNNLNLWNRTHSRNTWVSVSDRYKRIDEVNFKGNCIMLTLRRTDYGIKFIVQICDEQTNDVVDLSGATSINFVFRKPDKTTYTVSGSKYTDGSDGKVTYTSASTDFTMKGVWKLAVNYTMSLSFRTTEDVSFEVESLLTDLS